MLVAGFLRAAWATDSPYRGPADAARPLLPRAGAGVADLRPGPRAPAGTPAGRRVCVPAPGALPGDGLLPPAGALVLGTGSPARRAVGLLIPLLEGLRNRLAISLPEKLATLPAVRPAPRAAVPATPAALAPPRAAAPAALEPPRNIPPRALAPPPRMRWPAYP